MDSVHRTVNHTGAGPRWTTDRGGGGHSEAWELPNGGATERGGHRDPSSGLTGARAVVRRPGDDGEEAMEEALGAGSSRARREEKESKERCARGRRGSLCIGAEGEATTRD
jgi:hypothetical protein